MSEQRDDRDAREFLQVFRRGVQFTEELLQETERLRQRIARLERENQALAEGALGEDSFRELLERMRGLEQENQALQQGCAGVEGEELASRYRELEAETDRLANLYVAIYQLHSTLALDEVVRITFEILINLVGAGRSVLYAADGRRLVPIRAHGRSLGGLAPLELGQGAAGEAAARGQVWLAEAGLAGPVACVPLQVAERLIGLLVIEAYLPQKSRPTELDHELLRLLATHAGMALYASALSARSGDAERGVVEELLGMGRGERS